MAVLFSKVSLAADNGAKTVFLCCGIPDGSKSLEGYTAYEEFLDENNDASTIRADVKSYIYGEGEVVEANLYEIAYFSMRGEDFYSRPSVSEYGHSNFMINVDEINGRICGVELEM
jgi:hypothetical protein